MTHISLFQSSWLPKFVPWKSDEGLIRTKISVNIRYSRSTQHRLTHSIRHSYSTRYIRGAFFSLIERPERYDASDWARSLTSLPRSIILKRVSGRIIPNLIVAAVASAAYACVSRWAPEMEVTSVSSLPHTFLATAMSLLLVFRTNAAYDRYWEGRKIWGRLVNISRNMARMCVSAMPRDHAYYSATLIVMFSYALMHHLQGRREDQPFENLCHSLRVPQDLRLSLTEPAGSSILQDTTVSSQFLDDDRRMFDNRCCQWISNSTKLLEGAQLAKMINNSYNKPLEVVLQLGVAIRLSLQAKEEASQTFANGTGMYMNISSERQMLEQSISDLIDAMGACERLVKSPVPLSWSRHTSRLLSLWSLTLPFVLVPLEGFLCIPTVAVISWGIFSIEEIAHILEDPFLCERYSLPLADLCATIEKDIFTQIIT